MYHQLSLISGVCIAACMCLASDAAASDARGNAAYTGFQLLEEPTSPAAIAMGSAATASAGHGFSWYNPALPSLLPAPYLAVEYGRYVAGDLSRAHFETAWPFARWFAGLSVHTEAIDDIIATDYFGRVNTQSTFSAQLSHAAIGAGITRGKVSVGLCVNGVQERIAEYIAYALSASAGLIYTPVVGKLAFGLSAMHAAGSSTSMLDTTLDWGEGARLPKAGRFGASWRDTIAAIGYTIALDAVFRNADRRIMVPLGIEVRPFEQVAVRAGKRFNHDTEIFNAGCGLTIAPLSCDVSFVVPKLVDDAELKWCVAITYTLKERLTLRRQRGAAVIVHESEAPVISPQPPGKSESTAPPAAITTPPAADSAAAPDSAAGSTAGPSAIPQSPVPVERASVPDDGTDGAASDAAAELPPALNAAQPAGSVPPRSTAAPQQSGAQPAQEKTPENADEMQ